MQQKIKLTSKSKPKVFPPCTRKSIDRIICSYLGGVSQPPEFAVCRFGNPCWMSRKDRDDAEDYK